MAFISSADDSLTAFVHQEPLRFTDAAAYFHALYAAPYAGKPAVAGAPAAALDGAVSRRLTLLRAPAGFGKTTLLAQWYRHRLRQGDALAWLSLEEDDNAPLLFMRYLQEALRPLWQGGARRFCICYKASFRPSSPVFC
jgi:LuxR family maltose regulon positive regulatory protein